MGIARIDREAVTLGRVWDTGPGACPIEANVGANLGELELPLSSTREDVAIVAVGFVGGTGPNAGSRGAYVLAGLSVVPLPLSIAGLWDQVAALLRGRNADSAAATPRAHEGTG